MRVDSFNGVVREVGPYVILAAGVVLALHGKATEGLITGAFALIQAAIPRPTGGSSDTAQK